MLDKTYDPKEIEARLYPQWEKSGAFRAHPELPKPPYCIVIPPPNVTGSLHMGHALDNTLQDVLIRWRRMKGDDALWQPGTDHAGIATQMVVVRNLEQEGIGLAVEGADKGDGNKKLPEPRGVSGQGLGVEGLFGRHHHQPAPSPRRLVRLVARALHHGRGPVARRPEGVRRPLQGRPDLQGQPAGQLGSQDADGDLRPRGRNRARSAAACGTSAIPSRAATSTSSWRPPGPRPCWATPAWPCIPTIPNGST